MSAPTAITAAAIGCALVLAALPVTLLSGVPGTSWPTTLPGAQGNQVPADPVPVSPPVPSPAASVATLTLRAGPPRIPSFPFTPTADTDRFGKPKATLVDGQAQLSYTDPPNFGYQMTVTTSAEEPTADVLGNAASTPYPLKKAKSVATFVTPLVGQPEGWAMYWADRSGQWVRLSGTGAVDQDALVEYANGLTERPMAVVAPFQLLLMPANLKLVEVNQSMMVFLPDNAVAIKTDDGQRLGGKLVIMLVSGVPGNDPARSKVAGTKDRVTMDPGNGQGEVRYLVDIDEDPHIVVQMPNLMAPGDNDLARFLLGITVDPRAEPTAG